MYGSAQIRIVYGSAQISYVYGSAQIRNVYGYEQISCVYGSAQISYVYGYANILFVDENASVSTNVIEFLEKQLKIREELSKNNKKNVEKRYQSTENIEKNSTTVDESVYNIEERIIRGEDNKIRKENIIKENNIDSRKLKFASTLKPFLEKYGKDLLNNFYAYWTEPNKSNTKFRQELEKAWDIDRRLATWASRDKNFIKQTEQQTAKKRHQPT